MKTKFTILAIFALFGFQIQAQDITTVRANSSDISDNLDLRAVASIFGESADLADFERRLNDPKIQISNLDLNGDNQVDYLRVIETVEKNTHLIIIQAVLDRDIFQDIATVEVEKDRNNNVQVQVVGDVYMYGNNYIYEPIYVQRPLIYNVFWTNYYRPYYSPWYWSYYPSYFYAWNPYPVYRYHRNVNVYINVNNQYNYVNTRRSSRAVAMYSTRRSDGYARQNPNRSFAQRNNSVSNRYELVQSRNQNENSSRNQAVNSRSNSQTDVNSAAANNRNTVSPVRNASQTRNTSTPVTTQTVRSQSNSTINNTVRESNTRTTSPVRNTVPASSPSTTMPVKAAQPVRNAAPAVQSQAPVRTQSSPARVQQAPISSPSRSSVSPASRSSQPQNAAPARSSGSSSSNVRGRG